MSGPAEILRLAVPMMRGPAVRAVQEALVRRELMPRRGIDGLYGPQTKSAVARFQTRAGLPATGEVDPATGAALAAGAQQGDGPAPPRRRRGAIPTVVPAAHLPEARPRRVVLHWTAGGANASATDRQHYHFLIQQDGEVVRGTFSIADNESTAERRYAAHTRMLNTRSVGVALCGMAGAHESPFREGAAPIRAAQLEVLAALVAQICDRYAIPVTRETVLAHGEVQAILGVRQNAKWDPLVLPWRRDWSKREVGDHLRALVAAVLEGVPEEADEEARPLDLELMGRTIPGGAIASDGAITVPLAGLLALDDWRVAQVEEAGARLMAGDSPILVRLPDTDDPPTDRPETDPRLAKAAIALEDLAEQLDLAATVSPDGTRVSLSRPEVPQPADGTRAFKIVTVLPGDTLSAIARREFGKATDWARILRMDRTPFDEASARRLAAGEQVLVPAAALDEAAAAAARMIDDDQLGRIAEAIAADTFPENRAAVREHLPRILGACRRHGVTDPAHVAYVLATAEHETNFGRAMVERWVPTARQKRYEKNKSNERAGDGRSYLGRGFVQLTFRENYRKFARALGEPLEDDPDRAADPDIAAEVLALGMSRVGYRHPKLVLNRYGFGDGFDFERAREIVNADIDRFEKRYEATIGVGVGRRARRYYRSLSLLLKDAAAA